eukprot:110497-Rhodomonas_salina.1
MPQPHSQRGPAQCSVLQVRGTPDRTRVAVAACVCVPASAVAWSSRLGVQTRRQKHTCCKIKQHA